MLNCFNLLIIFSRQGRQQDRQCQTELREGVLRPPPDTQQIHRVPSPAEGPPGPLQQQDPALLPWPSPGTSGDPRTPVVSYFPWYTSREWCPLVNQWWVMPPWYSIGDPCTPVVSYVPLISNRRSLYISSELCPLDIQLEILVHQ